MAEEFRSCIQQVSHVIMEEVCVLIECVIRAVLQYQIIQEPRVSRLLSGSRVQFLNDTIQAHRYALSLNQENADILFNTAQVLTTAAEAAQESKDPETQREATDLLKEAVELFSSCLARQELEFTESHAQADAILTHPNEEEDLMEESSSLPDPPEEWATVMEPVTASSLVETALAQLSTLSTLISLSSSISGTDANEFRAFAHIGATLIQQKLPQYISLVPETSSTDVQDKPAGPYLSLSDAEPKLHMENLSQPSNPKVEASGEASIATGIFTAVLAEAEYRAQLCTTRTYYDRIIGAFDSLETQITTTQSMALLSAYADALVSFASTVSEMPLLPSDRSSMDESEAEVQTLCWKALSKAQDLLAEAIKTFTSQNTSVSLQSRTNIFLMRGDIDLLRRQLALSPNASPAIAGSSSTLLKNAGVYYRTAEGYAKTGTDLDEDEKAEASIKAAVVKVLEGDTNAINNLKALVMSIESQQAAAKTTDMIDEGLLGDEDKLKLNDVIAAD